VCEKRLAKMASPMTADAEMVESGRGGAAVVYRAGRKALLRGCVSQLGGYKEVP
jgi:hypothetical protein